jgi:hypothetical protein
MTMKNGVFWDVTQYEPHGVIPEDGILHGHRRKNLKS